MKNNNKFFSSTKNLVTLSLLTAIVAILSYLGGFIKIGGLASISLTLIPVVVGAAMLGPWAGAWLGGVSGVIFFATADAAFWFGLNIGGTIITVLTKGVLAGLAAGLVYKALEGFNRYVAIIVAAVACPVVNTGVFLLGCIIFFMDTVQAGAIAEGLSAGAYLILFFVGLNFVFEFVVNVVVSPAIARIVDIAEGKFKKTAPTEESTKESE